MYLRIVTIILASAITSQADILTSTQRFLGLGGQSPDYSEEAGETDPSVLGQAPYSPADSDLGVQEILTERASREPVIFNFNTSILRTDSAPSEIPFNDRSSWVFSTYATVAWRPHLAYGWFADLGVGQDLVRYDRSNSANFENLNTWVGAYRVFPGLDDAILFARFEYQRLTTGSISESDYTAQRLRLGVQKSLWETPRQRIDAGLSGAYEWSATPDRLQRNEVAAELSHTYSITDSLYTVVSARASYFDFDQFGRNDWTYAFSAELVWQFTETLSASASLMFDKNVSDSFGAVNEYESWSAGVAIGLQLSF